ncbi:MAG: 4Fe-4S binding protein [Erysipelothrix sp.]|nr:4Fe-4S binding protein [Erysipelothrix sp.]
MAVTVNQDTCAGVQACIGVCPTGALSMNPDNKAECDAELCIDCGVCIEVCPMQAISF